MDVAYCPAITMAAESGQMDYTREFGALTSEMHLKVDTGRSLVNVSMNQIYTSERATCVYT